MSSTFGERLDHLITTVHPAGRGPLTNAEIAREVTKRGHKVTASYITQIRRGTRGTSGVAGQLVLTLADMFGVPPTYFYDDVVTDDLDKQLELVAAVRDAGVERIATRLMSLSTEELDAVDGLIEHLQKIKAMRDSREQQRDPGDDAEDGAR